MNTQNRDSLNSEKCPRCGCLDTISKDTHYEECFGVHLAESYEHCSFCDFFVKGYSYGHTFTWKEDLYQGEPYTWLPIKVWYFLWWIKLYLQRLWFYPMRFLKYEVNSQ